MTRDDEPAASFSGRVGRDRGGSGAVIGLVAVFVVGIAAAIASGTPDGPADGSAGPSLAATATGATGPTPRTGATSTPECDPIDPSGPVPFFRLGSTTFPIGVRGRLGSTRGPSDPAEPDSGWSDPGPEGALAIGPTDRVFLVFGTADCIESAEIGWRSIPEPDADPEPGLFRVTYAAGIETSDVRVEVPDVEDLVARGIDDREFLLRIHVDWWPDVNPGMVGGESWTILYFRVRIAADPVVTPAPRPMVTPAVPCKFYVSEGGVGARLYVPGGTPVFGPPDPADAPPVVIPGDPSAEIGLDGDGCAIEWVVEAVEPRTLEALITYESVPNPRGDPGLISQNRWRVQGVPAGLLLHIRYRSSASGAWLDAWWLVVGPPGE